MDARNAEHNALGSVTPAMYIASTAAMAARRYVPTIATIFSVFISPP